ncbi:hypothetical protein ACFL13_03190, partial [Patescibacteria group bacterium]
ESAIVKERSKFNLKEKLQTLKSKFGGGRKTKQRVSSIVDSIPIRKRVKKPKIEKGPNIKIKRSLKPKMSLSPKLLIPVVLILLAGSIIWTRSPSRSTPDDDSVVETTEEVLNEVPEQDVPPAKEDTTEEDEKTNTTRVVDEAFYDIALADSVAKPENIVAFDNTVVVTDKTSGKIFTSSISTPKFEALENVYVGIDNTARVEKDLYFSYGEGYGTYDLVNGKLVNSYIGEFGITGNYIGNIYSLKDGKITKYVPEEGSLTGSTWGEDEALKTAKDLDVAYSIFVLTDNNLMAYTSGEKGDFEITGLDKPFANAVQVVASIDFDNIYVADAGNGRVVVLSNEGEFVKQFKLEGKNWNNLRGISVSADESELWVLDGSRVYKIALVQ